MSISGDTKEMIIQAENFMKSQIPIIVISANQDSALAQLADYALIYNIKVQRIKDLFDMTSQMPAIYILEKLSQLVYEKMSQDVTF